MVCDNDRCGVKIEFFLDLPAVQEVERVTSDSEGSGFDSTVSLAIFSVVDGLKETRLFVDIPKLLFVGLQ